jgi:hypothetical protein
MAGLAVLVNDKISESGLRERGTQCNSNRSSASKNCVRAGWGGAWPNSRDALELEAAADGRRLQRLLDDRITDELRAL